MRKLCISYIIMTLLATLPSHAQGAKRQFTLDDLIPGGSTFYQTSYPETKYTTWWGDRLIELDMEQVSEVSTANASHTSLFTLDDVNKALTAAGLRSLRHLYYSEFPYPSQSLVLVATQGERALVDWKEQHVVWSQTFGPDDNQGDWNPQSRNLAYVDGHNLFVVTADGDRRQLSHDGSLDITYGESVHRDEFGISKGTFWSPDGRRLAFYRMDQSMVSKYPQVQLQQHQCATLDPDPYPMAGATSHKVQVGIYDVEAGTTVYLNTGNPTDRYFTNIAWNADGSTLYLIELNRDQNHATLDAYDPQTGQKTATLLEENNDKYVEPLHPVQFLPWDSQTFIYQTRNRDGYNHIFVGSLKTPDRLRCLTPGTYEVTEILGFDTVHKAIIYASNESETIGQGLWSVDTKGRRHAIGAREGWHNASLSASGTYVVDNWTNGAEPTVGRRIDLVDTQRGRVQNLLTADEPWQNYEVPEIRIGTIKAADGLTDLYYRIVLPTGFDPTKKYPAIVYVYGGPHAHNIDSSRHYGVRGWDIYMAQQGYVMFCLDNRGSEHRGLEFEQATFRKLGTEEMRDQMCGINYLKSLPYVDAERLGVHGWSFGGFMTTNLITSHAETFKVGVAGGPVIDWRYYEVMYGERYMDTPQQNPEGYAEADLTAKAGQLQGRLLIIYGGNDPTCVPQHTLSFIRAAIDAGTHPDLFIYPGDGHNMMGTDRVHLHEHITRYFQDHL